MPVRRKLQGEDLDQLIIAMHEEGRAPSDIGHDLAITVDVVRERLQANGYEPGSAQQHAVHPMWKTESDADRRYAIWKKQQEGARRRRRELREEDRHAVA